MSKGIEQVSGSSVNGILEATPEGRVLTEAETVALAERFGGMEKLLQAFVDKGYLLHGSNNSTEVLEPRPPKDLSGSPENSVTAVYAGTSPSMAVFMSIVSRELIRQSGERVSFGVGDGFYASHSLTPYLANGYVHVLERSKFTPSDEDDPDGQNISYESVSPRLVIPVQPSDFKHDIEVRPRKDQ